MTAFISCEPTAGRHCHHCGISGTHRWRRLQHSRYLIHDKFQQEGTLPWQCISWAWAMSGLSCGSWDSLALRPQWSLHLQRPQSHKSHGGETAGHRRLSRLGRLKAVSFCNSTKASALPVDLQLQSRQWALWHWCGPTPSSDVLRASWNYTSCLQKQERQAAVMGSRVTSCMVGRHLPMHMAR